MLVHALMASAHHAHFWWKGALSRFSGAQLFVRTVGLSRRLRRCAAPGFWINGFPLRVAQANDGVPCAS